MSRLVRDSSNGDLGKCGKLGGDIDGTNVEFTCSYPLAPGAQDFVLVYLNGQLLTEGATKDYMLGEFSTVLRIHFNTAPPVGTDSIDIIYYAIAGGAA